MLFRSRPVMFDYGRRRSRWRPPRWLVLLLFGAAAGAGGVVFVQERYLPRLSIADSAELRSTLSGTEAERVRLAAELARATKQLESTGAEKAALASELSSTRALAVRLRDDLSAVVAALPPDPRSGAVEVRAARFSASGGMLAYDVVLTRERAQRPLAGVLQLVVTGDSSRRGETSVSLKPITLSLGAHEVVRGSQPLPEGFKPRQTTVQVLDRPAGKLLGLRMLLMR